MLPQQDPLHPPPLQSLSPSSPSFSSCSSSSSPPPPSSSSSALQPLSFASSSATTSPTYNQIDHLHHQRLLLQEQQLQAQRHLQQLQTQQRSRLLQEHRQHQQQQQHPPQHPSSSDTAFAPISQGYPHHHHPYQNPLQIDPSSPTSPMDILSLAPFPLHSHNPFLSDPMLLQQPLRLAAAISSSVSPSSSISSAVGEQQQQQQKQQQKEQQRYQSFTSIPASSTSVTESVPVQVNPYLQPLQRGDHPWIQSENVTLTQGSHLTHTEHDPTKRVPHLGDLTLSSESDMLAGYAMDARIIQKKDQMGELTASGAVFPAPVVEEVRTGQQFLIKLQLSKPNATQPPPKFPTLRVDRREAINTAGEPRAEAEALTLQIIVHLAKTGQVRKGACAKCCHKYGPSSPILVLLDPLSPSVTDPSGYAHVDTSNGSITILAKVICSSTDHGERGNKDRYQFEFRLKRTSSMFKMNNNLLGMDPAEEDGETVASCFTAPIMCSGHHKAKKAYPQQRPSKETPVPQTKTIKRHKSVSDMAMPLHNSTLRPEPQQADEFLRSGSISSTSSFPSPLSFLQDGFSRLPNGSVLSVFPGDQSMDMNMSQSSLFGQQALLAPATTSTDGMASPTAQAGTPLQPQFTPLQAPRILEVRPNQGPIRKTTDVILRGLCFRDGMVPYFGCFPALDIVVETTNLIICKAPESPMPGTVPITIYDSMGTSYADLSQFTYTDDSETELLILQLQLRLAHRALEYLHTQATGQRGSATDILREMPGFSQSSSGSASGGMMMSASGFQSQSDSNDTDSEMLSLEQVEEGILKTLDELPMGMDISMQLEDQSNLLHLSVLLGFDRLSRRLIDDGCDLEAQDVWSMTPLMYAVSMGNEPIVRSLVLAGATSSGARTPGEFYASLPRAIAPTLAVVGYLTVACTRYSTTSRTIVRNPVTGRAGTVEIQEDAWSSSDDSEMTDVESQDEASPTPLADQIQSAAPKVVVASPLEEYEDAMMAQLASNIQGVHMTHDMPPLDQQDLPQLQTMASDGSIIINTKVLKGDEIPRGIFAGPVATTVVAQESGYHSGVYSDVQDRLSLMNHAELPSKGVHMEVLFNKTNSPSAAAPSVATPANLFRTGDSFGISVQLSMIPDPSMEEEQTPLPKEFLGLRFPHEMVKKVNGNQTSLLNDMTYNLRCTIELGNSASKKTASTSESQVEPAHSRDLERGDGVPLVGACPACAKFLHENKALSPSRLSQLNPTAYPILQFSVPGPATSIPSTTAAGAMATTTASSLLEDGHGEGVIEMRDGKCDIKGKVNCSSLHHLIQREKARRTAALKKAQLEKQLLTAASSSSTAASSTSSTALTSITTSASSTTAPVKTRTPLAMTDLEDPGFVFKFELVHPTLNTVVASSETGPILFQSYSRSSRGRS